MDGSHVPAYVVGDVSAYRDRRGNLSQNILAICNFDRQFTYIYPG